MLENQNANSDSISKITFGNLLPELKDSFYLAYNEKNVENKTLKLARIEDDIAYVIIEAGCIQTVSRIHMNHFDKVFIH